MDRRAQFILFEPIVGYSYILPFLNIRANHALKFCLHGPDGMHWVPPHTRG